MSESAAQGRRIAVDACWCSEDGIEPKYGHAEDHILARADEELRARSEIMGTHPSAATESAAQTRNELIEALRVHEDTPICEAKEPISGVQCERPEGHGNAHIFVGDNSIVAWGWPS